MAVETKQVARLIKRNKNNKIRKVVTIYQNDLGWVKIRTDLGKEQWVTTIEELNNKVDRWLLQGYTWDGNCDLPTEITSRFDVSNEPDW